MSVGLVYRKTRVIFANMRKQSVCLCCSFKDDTDVRISIQCCFFSLDPATSLSSVGMLRCNMCCIYGICGNLTYTYAQAFRYANFYVCKFQKTCIHKYNCLMGYVCSPCIHAYIWHTILLRLFGKNLIHMHRLFRRNLHAYILWSCGIHMHSMTQMVNGQPQIHECRARVQSSCAVCELRTESSLSVCGWSYGIYMHSMIHTYICGKALCRHSFLAQICIPM